MDERTGAVSHEESTDGIRRDIARTQREMSHTIDEIQYRLSPDHIKEQIKERARQKVRNAAVRSRGTIDRVKSNPLGAALVGAGLWLMFRNHDDDQERYTVQFDEDYTYGADYAAGRGRMSHMAEAARERIHDAVDSAGERVHSLQDEATERLHNTADRARSLQDRAMYGARRASMRGQDFLTESPLIAGVAAIAFGAIIGAMIPESDRENELFGESRDRLKDQAADLARQGVDQAKSIAKTAANAATDAARREVKTAKDELRPEQ